MTTTERVKVYSMGIVAASVCAEAELTPEQVAFSMNLQHPTGIDSLWTVAEEVFKTGEANPHECESDPSRLHYLLTC